MNTIQKFNKRHALELVMFGWVMGLNSNFDGMTQRKCIANFLKKMNISEDEWKLNSAEQTFQRMMKEFYEQQKTPADVKEKSASKKPGTCTATMVHSTAEIKGPDPLSE